jgi:tripartite-type tricarboxylate transporter receptor subunit TctC
VKLATEVDRIERDPGFRKRMYFDRGIEPANARLEEFAHFIEQERTIAERMVREAGLQPE